MKYYSNSTIFDNLTKGFVLKDICFMIFLLVKWFVFNDCAVFYSSNLLYSFFLLKVINCLEHLFQCDGKLSQLKRH